MSLGGLPEGVWPPQDGLQSLCPLERAGHLAENIRGGCFSFRVAETSRAGQQSCQGSSLRQRRKRGAEFQAIGLTKGGRNSKIHAIVDKFLRPWVLILNRKKRIRHNKKAYKKRNVIERCFGRLKDFRRIATRYDKLAGNFFSALCLVAIVAYWL